MEFHVKGLCGPVRIVALNLVLFHILHFKLQLEHHPVSSQLGLRRSKLVNNQVQGVIKYNQGVNNQVVAGQVLLINRFSGEKEPL